MSMLEDLQNGSIDIKSFLEAQVGTGGKKQIQERLMSRVSDEYDKLQGSFMYDTITPATFEFVLSYLAMYQLFGIFFPQYSYGEFLKDFVAAFGIIKNEATKAYGKLELVGAPGTVIPKGTIFSTTVPANSAVSPKYFVSVEDTKIPENGTVYIDIEADTPGASGNVSADEINVLVTKTVSGITQIRNPDVIQNGQDAESDEALRARFFERAKNPPSSGNVNDYVRWAKEVPGVDEVIVEPLWAGPGTVKLTITNDGGAAVEETVNAVKQHLDPYPDGSGGGRAPIGAIVTVVTVKSIETDIRILNLTTTPESSLDAIKEKIKTAVDFYLKTVPLGGIIRITKIEAAIGSLAEVLGFDDVLIRLYGNGYHHGDITLSPDVKTTIGEVEYV